MSRRPAAPAAALVAAAPAAAASTPAATVVNLRVVRAVPAGRRTWAPADEMIGNRYERSLVAGNKTPATIRSYVDSLVLLSAYLDGRGADLLGCSADDVSDWLADGQPRWTPSSMSSYFRRAKTFFGWLVKRELRDDNPMAKLDSPSQRPPHVPVPHADHVQALLDSVAKDKTLLGRRDYAMLRLLCAIGTPRATELVTLTLANTDMRHDRITVVGKGRKTRTIPYGDKTATALMLYLRERNKRPGADKIAETFIAGKRLEPMTRSGLQQMIDRRCDAAGLPRLHPHAFRHFTAALYFGEHGGSERHAMKLFGWDSALMAKRYGDAAAEQAAIAEAAALRADDAF